MNIDHVNVKVMARPGADVAWHTLIPVFHRWIQTKAVPEMLIDVADYAHVPNGPGVMLIGHEAFYSVDNRAGRPGLLYNRRTAGEGSAADKIRQAYEAAVAAARRLEQEPEIQGKVTFDASEVEVFINDRLLAPNTAETFDAIRPSLEEVFPKAEVRWETDRRGLFRVQIKK
jgi:hypothetical protein